MTASVSPLMPKQRAPKRELESKTFKDGAIYLFQRAEYKKPIWFIRLKVPNVKGYLWKSSGTTDEHSAYKIAEDFYNESLGKVYAGVRFNVKKIGVSLDAFIEYYEERDTPDSFKHTITLAKRLKPAFKSRGFDELDTPLIVEMLDVIDKTSKKGQLSAGTMKRTHSHLKLILRWFEENGFIERIPKFPKVSASKNRRPHFDAKDWSKLTRHMREFIKTNHGPVRRDRMLLVNYVLILGNTGIRVGEARNLKWRDIRPIASPENPAKITVALVVSGKTGKRETVARTDDVRRYFERILELRRADLKNPKSDIHGQKEVPLDSYIFCGLDGKPIQTFKKSFNSLIESADVATNSFGEQRTIYSLRHTYATFRIQEGVNHYVLARNMGTSVAMLEDYYGHTTNVGMVEELMKSRAPKKKDKNGKSGSALSWLAE